MDPIPDPPPAMILTAENLNASAASHELGLFTVNHGGASVTLSVHGGNIVSYRPSEAIDEVIWTGGYKPVAGKDCWGGIPIVWPWFMMGTGETPKGPFHGPARFTTWNVLDVSQSDTATELRLGLPSPLQTKAGVPIPLNAELRIRLAETLLLELTTRNPSDQHETLEHCFHSYFKVGDVTRIRIDGLEGAEVQDNRSPGGERTTQLTPVTLDGPAARIYRPFPKQVTLEDPVLGRKITLRSPEAAQLVLWNSGPLREENGRQTGEAEWQSQIALEPLRGLEEAITLPPGGEARLTLEIHVAPINTSEQPATH